MYFKAFIRVIKSLNADHYNAFGQENIIREPLIIAENKDAVKTYLSNKYPSFFANGKVYEKETKDKAQFFYVVIYPLWQNEINMINEGSWICDNCGQIHENKYIVKPRRYDKLFNGKLFCPSDDDFCLNEYKKSHFSNVEFPDDEIFIRKDSLNYIYKITEKKTGKCYVGKTRNEPFFRWWNHLKHSTSPFGVYLRSTLLSEWVFEVIEILPADIRDSEVFKIESQYIKQYDSINNGFNSVISSKDVVLEDDNELNFI